MAYVAPIHRPESVRHGLRLRLVPDEECLVLTKTNRIEIWKIDPTHTQLQRAHSRTICGTITLLQKIRPRDADFDLLVVGTERFHYFTLYWDPNACDFQTLDPYFDVNEKFMRDSLSQDKCVVDPSGRHLIMLLWEGVLNIMRLKTQKTQRFSLEWKDQIRIRELYVKSATFIDVATTQPKIAFLHYEDPAVPKATVVTYHLYEDEKQTQVSRFLKRHELDHVSVPGSAPSLLIPVNRPVQDQKRYIVRNAAQVRIQLGGFLVVSETMLFYYDDAARKSFPKALDPSTVSVFIAWAEYDNAHYFVADDYGRLFMVEMVLEDAVVVDIAMRQIGETSRANVLVYMGHGLLFVGSHYGNSQVWKYNHDEKGKHGGKANASSSSSSSCITLVQTMPNISPVLDFHIMDLGNRENNNSDANSQAMMNEYASGQARIVTGSGVFKDGSIRSVRSGVGLEDEGILYDIDKDSQGLVKNLFPLRCHPAATGTPRPHDTLLVSRVTDTQMFEFDEQGGITQHVDWKGFQTGCETLLARNLDYGGGGRVLQVTAKGAYLIDLEDGLVVSGWEVQGNDMVTSVDANEQFVLLASGRREVVCLRINSDLSELTRKSLDMGGQAARYESCQVACIHLPPGHQNVGVMGFWDGTISVVDLQTLNAYHAEQLRRSEDDASIPRDAVLVQVLPPNLAEPTLFVAMDDGLVISFNVSRVDFALKGRKSVVLGKRYAKLQPLPQPDRTYNIFTASEYANLIYGSDGRIIYAAVNAEDVVCVCPFNTAAFGDLLAVSTTSNLKMSNIDRERRTHVHTLPMREVVRRLTYSPAEGVFGLGCISREIKKNVEVIRSSFKLVDDAIFGRVGRDYALDNVAGTELVEAVASAQFEDSYGKKCTRFVVGTSYLGDAGVAAGMHGAQGRILVLGIDSERNPYRLVGSELKGQCRCIATMQGNYIVAALTKTIVVFRYEEESSTVGRLVPLAKWRCVSNPIDIAVHGHFIAVADLMKSACLLEFIPGDGQGQVELVEVARHYESIWATAISHVEGNTWLQADAQGNLVVLAAESEGVTEGDRKRLRMTAEFGLGEQVNRIRKVEVKAGEGEGDIVVPRAFLGTVEGGVYLFGTIAPKHQDLLVRLQDVMAETIDTVGSVHFAAYRSFRNAQREGETPERFVDGDYAERFLDLDEETQGEICQGLGHDVEEMRNLVEVLKRLH